MISTTTLFLFSILFYFHDVGSLESWGKIGTLDRVFEP
jgi:hypothetical protein